MLEHIGEEKSAQLLEKAVTEVTGKHIKSLSAGKMGYSTSEVGDLVAGLVS
jgi:3-isopropylmalate dehydrogenase